MGLWFYVQQALLSYVAYFLSIYYYPLSYIEQIAAQGTLVKALDNAIWCDSIPNFKPLNKDTVVMKHESFNCNIDSINDEFIFAHSMIIDFERNGKNQYAMRWRTRYLSIYINQAKYYTLNGNKNYIGDYYNDRHPRNYRTNNGIHYRTVD